ncbi:MAG: hypothetical protein LBI77_02030 [Puniceicoccales bacterium]|jgi:hypothetical protein|nr:hypothetical protein [Puniceicoccales bacterium]
MIKFKYLLNVGFLCSSGVSASLLPSESSFQIQSQGEEIFLENMRQWFKSFSMDNKIKVSTFPEFLETAKKHLETAKEQWLAKVKEEEEEEEKEIQAARDWINERDAKIMEVWGNFKMWGNICGILENLSYEIAGRSLTDKENFQFFSELCKQWIELFDGKTAEQISQMEALGGFRYSLAIMLINAEILFEQDLAPLEGLWKAVYGEEKVLDFTNFETMKKEGMKIMKSASYYNLAYVYLGVENEK